MTPRKELLGNLQELLGQVGDIVQSDVAMLTGNRRATDAVVER